MLFDVANDLGSDGVFNFLLADGRYLYARCGDHCPPSCELPFGQATLVDADVRVNLGDVMGSHPDTRMAVVATHPLTRDEAWTTAAPGTLWVFRAGVLLAQFPEPQAS